MRETFWQLTYHDLKTKIMLYSGEKQALIVQEFQSLVEVAKLTHGSGEKEKTDLQPVKTIQEVRAGMAAVFG